MGPGILELTCTMCQAGPVAWVVKIWPDDGDCDVFHYRIPLCSACADRSAPDIWEALKTRKVV